MIRSTLLLARTSLPAVLLLAASLFTLANLLSDEPETSGAERSGSIPSLEPLPRAQPTAGTGSAILQNAIFDPARRSETISGSIDDLRATGQPASAPVSIAGVLLSGGMRKAMLSLGGSAPTWADVGGELGGWRIAAIDGDGAVLERDGQTLTLKVADRYRLRQKPQLGAAQPPAPELEPLRDTRLASPPVGMPPDP